ncbi:MAG: SH3 domain-containing protein [Aggregatilineales bacterium]
MRRLLLTSLFLIINFSVINAQNNLADCPDVVTPRLIVGVEGRVLPGEANRMRNQPTTAGANIGRIPAGAIFDVLAGPVCADGFNWWQVDYDGRIGWTVEGDSDTYWLQPLISTDLMQYELDYGDLAEGIDGMIFDANVLSSAPELSTPAFLYSILAGWESVSNTDASISIYPVAAYADLSDYTAETLAELRDILDVQGLPEDISDRFFLPNIMTAQMFRAHIGFVDFENGRGLRYITQFAQDMSPVHNAGTRYVFLGLTDDGAFFISALLPISMDFLPESYESADFNIEPENYLDYLYGVVSQINNAPPSAFTPNLAAIDAMFESLNFSLNTDEEQNAD